MKKSIFLLCLALLAQADEYAFSPPKELHLKNPRDFSLYAEALILQAKEQGLDFAIEDANGTVTNIRNGVVKGFSKASTDYDYNPGLRVGMGFLFGDDRWNFDFIWTFVKITESKSVQAPGRSVLIPLWLIPAVNQTNQSLHATWDTNFNVLDLRMGKTFQISRTLIANPHFGGRIAFIDQHFSVQYGGYFGAVRGAISHNDNDFAGLGIRGGLDSEWKLAPDWALIGNIAGAILWGRFETAQNLIQGVSEGYSVTQTLNQNTPNLEMSLGIAWGHSFRRDQFRLDARLSYEFHEWWDMNQLRRFFGGGPGYPNDQVSRGDLTLNGLSFRFQIDL
jgi:hypothetical protein